MTVLDASAVLPLIHDEPGSDLVAAHLGGGVLSTANLAEIVGTLVDADLDVSRLRPLLETAGVTLEPLSAADAELAGGDARTRRGQGALARRSLLPRAHGSQ